MTESSKATSTVEQRQGFVEIAFSSDISPEAVEAQVSACRDETCECCTPEFREEVDDIVVVEGVRPKVRVYGTISRDEVLENVIGCAPKLANSTDPE